MDEGEAEEVEEVEEVLKVLAPVMARIVLFDIDGDYLGETDDFELGPGESIEWVYPEDGLSVDTGDEDWPDEDEDEEQEQEGEEQEETEGEEEHDNDDDTQTETQTERAGG
jgi:hypothetical protein